MFLSSNGITEGRFSLRENQLQNLGNISFNDSRECLNTIINHFSNELNTLEKVLKLFFAIRDKKVAHTENCILPDFTNAHFKESFKLLLEFAKKFYNVITKFFGLRYVLSIGEFFSDYDINAKSASLSLQKIIEKISKKNIVKY